MKLAILGARAAAGAAIMTHLRAGAANMRTTVVLQLHTFGIACVCALFCSSDIIVHTGLPRQEHTAVPELCTAYMFVISDQ